jgi:hypothetical protein
VNFERLFDKTNKTAIWKPLCEIGLPEKIIDLIKEMHEDAGNRIKYKEQRSDKYYNNRGVRQGCVLSPLLFLIVLDIIMRKLENACS